MAQDIIYNVNINTGASNKSIQDVSNSIKKLDEELGELYKEQDKIRAQRDQFEKGQVLYDKWNKKLADVTNSVKKVEKEYGVLSNTLSTRLNGGLNTIQDLEQAQALLNEELKGVVIGSEEYKNLATQLGNVNRELKNIDLSQEVLDTEQIGSAARSAAGGLVDVANGLTLIGLEGESMENMVATMARVEGISYTMGGAIDTWSDGLKLVKNLQDRAAASTAILTTATTGQTVAQRALNLAMNANPAFILLTAVTALAAGFYLFTKRSQEAAKAQEKRAEATKLANEEAKKEREHLSSNSVAFVTLATRLKASNAGSKERADLMKEMNSKYGVYLGNIKDEAKFQEELNGHIINYIAYQKMKYDVMANEDYIKRNLMEQDKSYISINNTLKAYGLAYDKTSKMVVDKTTKETFTIDQLRNKYGDLANDITNYQNTQAKADERLLNYSYNINSLEGSIDELTNAGKRYEEQETKTANATSKTTKEYKDASKTIDELISNIERLDKAEKDRADYDGAKKIEQEIKAQEKLAEVTGTYSTSTLKKLIDAEKKRHEDYIKNKYKEQIAIAKAKNQTDLVAALILERDLELEKSAENYTNIKLDGIAQIETAQENYAERQAERNEEEEESIKRQAEVAQEVLDSIHASAQATGDILTGILDGSFAAINDGFAELQENIFGEEGFMTKIAQALTGEDGLDFKITNMIHNIADAMMVATEVISAFSEEKLSEQMENSQKIFDDSENQYKEALANREITQAEYDVKVKRLEQAKRERERKADQDAFKRAKTLAIVQATITGAQAILAAFQSGAAYPFIGPATGAIFAGIAGALVGAQIAVISSQQYRAARGGIVPGSKGSQDFDSVNALLAPGEVVINSRSAGMFPDLLSNINEAGGGIPLVPRNINNSQNGMDSSQTNTPNNGNVFITEAVISETAMTESLDNINRLKRKQRFS